MHYKRIAIDTSKYVFTLHGVDDAEQPVLRRELRRAQVEPFFRKLPPTVIVLEACGASHHWARLLRSLGHQVQLVAPQYVKPFVKRGKNDRIDAQAISEAAARPGMRFVPVKSAQAQAEAMLLSARDLLVRQRTQLINAVRGHCAEFGVIGAKGDGLAGLLSKVAAEESIPAEAREMVAFLADQIGALQARIGTLDHKIAERHKTNPVSQLLAEVPGIGPLTALTLATKVDARQFHSPRHFAAWLGLTPREHSTGGKTRLGGISRQGNERLRQLLVVGATSVIFAAGRPGARVWPWLQTLLERRPRKVAAVALANKMARIAWAMMVSGEAYRRKPA